MGASFDNYMSMIYFTYIWFMAKLNKRKYIFISLTNYKYYLSIHICVYSHVEPYSYYENYHRSNNKNLINNL